MLHESPTTTRPRAVHPPAPRIVSRAAPDDVPRAAVGVPRSRDDALGTALRQAVCIRASAAAAGPHYSHAPRLQRMLDTDGNREITTLGDLNAALRRLGNLDLMPPAAGPGAPAPVAYALPLTVAAFAPPSTATRVDQAIAEAATVLWDSMNVQEVIDDVNLILAGPALEPVPVIPPAAIDFDPHGWKHFGGNPRLKVRMDGAQWTLGMAEAQRLMTADIARIEPHLRAHQQPNAAGVTLYYYTTTNPGVVGYTTKPRRDSSLYTIQIDYNGRTNSLEYHGYPDAGTGVGLGHGKNNKQWNV